MSQEIPAFPCEIDNFHKVGNKDQFSGMTLRDYFAGQALFAAAIGMEKGLTMVSLSVTANVA